MLRLTRSIRPLLGTQRRGSIGPIGTVRCLQGLMMRDPLLISSLIVHADRHHGDVEVVSRRVEGDVHRYTYRDMHKRAKKIANTLTSMGIKQGDRIGTLAVNGYRHMELYFGVSGYGAVLHTINPRLFVEHIRWIINHAQDRVVFFDPPFLPIIQAIASTCPSVDTWVCMVDPDKMPTTSGESPKMSDEPPKPPLQNYESLVDAASDVFTWPTFDEHSASSLCYTSGTTGNPKGVLYSHRSTVLHSYAVSLPDSLNFSARDVLCTVVPLFHVNAWGIPYAACLVGSKIVFPGMGLDGKSLYTLMEMEKVTVSAGVPTVWLGLLNYVKHERLRFNHMTRTVVGGAACPPAMLRTFSEDYDVQALHAWGMTETSPLGTGSSLKGKHLHLHKDDQYDVLCKQGRAIYGVDMKIVDDNGKDLPWDGKACGELCVRGPWIISQYYNTHLTKQEVMHIDEDGTEWFPTGDVATIDEDGYMQITDRSKDVIKSGGEWISSIDLENVAMAHPKVALAAAIACFHPKWDERPLLVCVKKDADLTREDVLIHFKGKVARWCMPDDVVFVEEIPIGATGKILKNQLREKFKAHKLPSIRS